MIYPFPVFGSGAGLVRRRVLGEWMQLSGNIANFSLPELLQVMGNGGKSGVLTISGPEGSARIFFQEGHVVHAEAGELSGEEGFYRLFRFREGDFSFTGGAVAPSQTIFVDNTTLMLEAARLLDEEEPRPGAADGERLSSFPVGGELGEFGELHLDEPGYEAFTGWDVPPIEELVGPEVAIHPKMLDAAERLSTRLDSCGDASDYVVWSRDGLLKSGDERWASGLFASLDAPGLSEALDGAQEAGDALLAGKLQCVAAASNGGRAAVFGLSGLVAAVNLARGTKPLEFMEKVRQVESVASAANGAKL